MLKGSSLAGIQSVRAISPVHSLIVLILICLSFLGTGPVGADEMDLPKGLHAYPYYPIGNLDLRPMKFRHADLGGKENRGMCELTLGGRTLALKRIGNEWASVSEIWRFHKLSGLELTPEFVGVTQFADGSLGLMTEYIAPAWLLRDYWGRMGENLRQVLHHELALALASVPPRVVERWRAEIKRIFAILSAESYLVLDPNFLVTPSGRVYLIDVRRSYPRSDLDYAARNRSLAREFLKALD